MDGHSRQVAAGFRTDITLGNVISWAVMIMTMGIVYGTISQTVTANTKTNERQDVMITNLQGGLTDLRVAIAEGNGDLRLMRQILQSMQGDGVELKPRSPRKP